MHAHEHHSQSDEQRPATGDAQHSPRPPESQLGDSDVQAALAGPDGHAMHDMSSSVTTPQLAAVTFLTILALAGAFLFSITRYNLTLSAHDVGGLIMPPGMIMNRETTAEAMRDMAA